MEQSQGPATPAGMNNRISDSGKTLSRDIAAAFGEAVAILIRSPFHHATFLPELEWMLAPGIASGQYAIAHRTDSMTGAQTAIGFVTWAMVSDEVNQRLLTTNSRPKLKPLEWRSGKTAWLIEAAGDAEATRNLIATLMDRQFAVSGLNIMQQGPDGKFRATRIAPKVVKPADAAVN